ncbi:MAG TPA: type II toxin-antitoxin system mRNA interferase toxin, RelE/StbE family [Burkholderiaceae bacterium]|nr:type II toxin-antitoxin system mRNA interferase toxin, RelE/StbE family [Burkholderiaceae bacterium]
MLPRVARRAHRGGAGHDHRRRHDAGVGIAREIAGGGEPSARGPLPSIPCAEILDMPNKIYAQFGMWRIDEYRRVDRQLAGAPIEILKRYEKWKDIAAVSGPSGLRLIKGFRDEALAGQWKGHRSSRLGIQWRVIYRIVGEVLVIEVVAVTPHDYRRR